MEDKRTTNKSIDHVKSNDVSAVKGNNGLKDSLGAITKENLEGMVDKDVPEGFLKKTKIYFSGYKIFVVTLAFIVWYFIVKYLLNKILSVTNSNLIFAIAVGTFIANLVVKYYRIGGKKGK